MCHTTLVQELGHNGKRVMRGTELRSCAACSDAGERTGLAGGARKRTG